MSCSDSPNNFSNVKLLQMKTMRSVIYKTKGNQIKCQHLSFVCTTHRKQSSSLSSGCGSVGRVVATLAVDHVARIDENRRTRSYQTTTTGLVIVFVVIRSNLKLVCTSRHQIIIRISTSWTDGHPTALQIAGVAIGKLALEEVLKVEYI